MNDQKVESKLRLLPDVPLGEASSELQETSSYDGLKFYYYANILAKAAIDTPEAFTIGIFGGWGSGKTSLMRMMMNIINGEKDTIGIWFNAWRYEKEEHLIIPLLATIITTIQANQKNFSNKVKKSTKQLLNAFRGVLYGFSVKGKVGIPGLSEAELSLSTKDMIERYETLNQVATDRLINESLYFKAFSHLSEMASISNNIKLVVFIDDLDRCFPDKAVSLLEGIKLVLHQPQITFVLGIDKRIIQSYLAYKYKKEFNVPERLYEDYLEKLIQLPFRLPEVGDNIKDFARGLLKRKEIFGNISDNEFNQEYEPLVSICGPACKDNPRAIIRFLNRLLIMRKAYEIKILENNSNLYKSATKLSLAHFGITTALELKWPEVLLGFEIDPFINYPDADKEDTHEERLSSWLIKTFKELHDETNDTKLTVRLRKMIKFVDNPAKEILNELSSEKSLRSLFRSKPGLEWLQNPQLRYVTQKTGQEFIPKEKENTGNKETIIPEFIRDVVKNIKLEDSDRQEIYTNALIDSLSYNKNFAPSSSPTEISQRYILPLGLLRKLKILLTTGNAFNFISSLGNIIDYEEFIEIYCTPENYKTTFSRGVTADNSKVVLTYSETLILANIEPLELDNELIRKL